MLQRLVIHLALGKAICLVLLLCFCLMHRWCYCNFM